MKAIDRRTRVQLSNILFCTDLSDAANNALPYAAQLARTFEAKLFALYVKSADGDRRLEDSEIFSAPAESIEMQARTVIMNLLDNFPGIQSDILVEEGNVWPVLASVIAKKQIDLVVLGTRGRTGLNKLLLGSVAEDIFRQAPCPVLTVGPHSSMESSKAGEIAEILYATDFSPESLAAAPYAISLAEEYQANLTLLHVIAEPRRGDLVTPEQLLTSSERLLHDLVPLEAESWCKLRFMIERGAAAVKILEIAKERKADLIVLGVRRPSGGAATHLPIATAHKIVSYGNCPVLTVRV